MPLAKVVTDLQGADKFRELAKRDLNKTIKWLTGERSLRRRLGQQDKADKISITIQQADHLFNTIKDI